ncbi:hypothetical protein GCM10010178_43040 [Lentzea flava]|uniref:Tail terminator n=1 Tax=Lentzea flava TaxID=103732 RepID=A0ABQ2UN82_9PSEU|nr:hypothetical protein GCM10010178_43040 [Lentzea flava]
MASRRISRLQDVVLLLLRQALPGVQVSSWGADVDHRVFPYINVRRLGGFGRHPDWLDRATLELTVYHDEGLVAAEDLYLDARHALWSAVQHQTVTRYGHLSSWKESMGPTQFDSPWDDTWRIQGLIQLGLRPARL